MSIRRVTVCAVLVWLLPCWAGRGVALGQSRPAEGETAASRPASFLLPGDRVVVIGDSITHRGVYNGFIESYVRAFHPQLEAEFFNAGVGSDRAVDGLRRFDRDVMSKSPTVVVFCYGMNDAVVRRPNAPVDPVALKDYLDAHLQMIRRVREAGGRPFVLTPPCAREDLTGELEGHNARLEVFAAELSALAKREAVPAVDVFRLLRQQEVVYRKHYPRSVGLIPDGVHPGGAACMLMARAVLEAWNLAPPRPGAAQGLLHQGDRVMFLGDSITEQGLYTKVIQAWVEACSPELEVTFVTAGKGGETAPGGLLRLDSEVSRHAPSVVTILYGANDGGRTAEVDPARLKAYDTAMREIIHKLRQRQVRPFLLTCIGVAEDRSVDLKGTNRAWRVLARACLRLAREEGVPVVDLFHPMVAQGEVYRLYYPDDRLVWDGVHPKGPGSMFMAMQVVGAWGLGGPTAGGTAGSRLWPLIEHSAEGRPQ